MPPLPTSHQLGATAEGEETNPHTQHACDMFRCMQMEQTWNTMGQKVASIPGTEEGKQKECLVHTVCACA